VAGIGWVEGLISAVRLNGVEEAGWRTAVLYEGGDEGRPSHCCCCGDRGDSGIVPLAEKTSRDWKACGDDLLSGAVPGEIGDALDVSRAGIV